MLMNIAKGEADHNKPSFATAVGENKLRIYEKVWPAIMQLR